MTRCEECSRRQKVNCNKLYFSDCAVSLQRYIISKTYENASLCGLLQNTHAYPGMKAPCLCPWLAHGSGHGNGHGSRRGQATLPRVGEGDQGPRGPSNPSQVFRIWGLWAVFAVLEERTICSYLAPARSMPKTNQAP